MNECVVCYKQSETLCQRCRTPYCSRKCQTEDWPEHKATCIPMPLLVAAKMGELSTSKHQLNESVSSVSQRLKQKTNDSPPRSKQQANVSNLSQRLERQQIHDSPKPEQATDESTLESNLTQRPEHQPTNGSQNAEKEADKSTLESKLTQRPEHQPSNDSQNAEQEAGEVTLRPPKSKLPSEMVSPADTKVSSALSNPFKRNSHNIGFNVRKAEPSPGESNSAVTIPKEILSETNLPVPVRSADTDETESAEIILRVSNHKIPLKDEKRETVEATHRQENERKENIFTTKDIEIVPLQENERKENIFTMKDIEIVPLTIGKKIVCLDYSNIEKGYVSSCINDGKAVAFIDRFSSKIGDHCNKTDDCYRPQTGELCLCLFAEDNEWYRALVLDVIDSETFHINFIDFGNDSIACYKNIRKMPRKFLHHCLVNKCYIAGYDDASPEIKSKIEAFITNNQIFEVANMERIESGLYMIELDY